MTNSGRHHPFAYSALVFLVWIAFSVCPLAAQSSSTAAAAPIQPPAHPITRQQLEMLFQRFGTDEAQKTFIHDTLEARRSKFPAWFPQSVWSEAIRKVETIDTISIALPVYQKYLSEDTAKTLILFYDGDTGGQLARAWTKHALQAMDQGYRGGNAAIKAEDSMGTDQDVDALMRKRVSELGPEQGNSCLDALQIFNQFIFRINEEKNVIYMKKVQEVGQEVLAEHKAELDAAQRNASQKPAAH
jgi:hypothetical protein